MKIKNDKHILKVLGVMSAVAISGSLMASPPVNAASTSIDANVTWITPLALSGETDIEFGQVLMSFAADAGKTLIVSPTDVLTGTGTSYALGAPTAGAVTIEGSASGLNMSVTISNTDIPDNGFSISDFTCDDGDNSGACNSTTFVSSASSTLNIGATITAQAFGTAPADGTQSYETLTVDVSYQ